MYLTCMCGKEALSCCGEGCTWVDVGDCTSRHGDLGTIVGAKTVQNLLSATVCPDTKCRRVLFKNLSARKEA